MVQWLRLQAPYAGGPGLMPGQGTGSHMLRLRVCMLQLTIMHAATKTCHSQINTFFCRGAFYIICLFLLGMPGLCCCLGSSLVVASGGYPLVVL